MSEPPSQPSTARVAILAGIGILLAGLLVAGGIRWSMSRYGGGSACPAVSTGSTASTLSGGALATTTTFATSGPEMKGGGWVVVGDAADMRERAELSPYYLTLGGRCEYWVALENGALIAYKARLESDPSCAVIWHQPVHSFICHGSKELIPKSELHRWPARVITSGPNTNSFQIDFSQ